MSCQCRFFFQWDKTKFLDHVLELAHNGSQTRFVVVTQRLKHGCKTLVNNGSNPFTMVFNGWRLVFLVNKKPLMRDNHFILYRLARSWTIHQNHKCHIAYSGYGDQNMSWWWMMMAKGHLFFYDFHRAVGDLYILVFPRFSRLCCWFSLFFQLFLSVHRFFPSLLILGRGDSIA